MGSKCCGIAPTVIRNNGDKYCSECDALLIPKRSGYIELDPYDWMASSPSKKKEPECQCGSEKSGFKDCHVDWCPKYVKR